MDYNKETEYYLHHSVIRNNFVKGGYLQRSANHLTKLTPEAMATLDDLMRFKAKVLSRDNRKGYTAIIVKALIVNKDRNTIYLVDEKVNSGKEKVSILGGHMEPSTLNVPTIPLQEYIRSELVREMCEELTDHGYANFQMMYITEQMDAEGTMRQMGLDVTEEDDWYCHYAGDSLFIYIPFTINTHNINALNDSLVEYPYTQHKSMKSLLADGKHGIHTARYLFDIEYKNDVRITRPHLLDAIFNTLLGK